MTLMKWPKRDTQRMYCSIAEMRELAVAVARSNRAGIWSDGVSLNTEDPYRLDLRKTMKPSSGSTFSCVSDMMHSVDGLMADLGRSVRNDGTGRSTTSPPRISSRGAPRISANQPKLAYALSTTFA